MSDDSETQADPRERRFRGHGQRNAAQEAPERFHLLVIEGETSEIFELPRTGEVAIGRGDTARLRLRDAGASRRHAVITMTNGDARLEDVGSHNGTYLNGERVVESRALSSADVITIGEASLVYHSSRRSARRRPILESDAFRRRIEEELERCAGAPSGTMALLAIDLGTDDANLARLSDVLSGHLRLVDAVGRGSARQLLLLLPDTGQERARAACTRVLELLEKIAPQVRGGLATYPADGCDASSLLAGARAALENAAPQSPASASTAFRQVQLGDRNVVLADPAMIQLYALIERLAPAELSILICGETGSGKEVAAAAVHTWSGRKGSLVAISCVAIPESLFESQLFGHEKGAFSGAVASRAGLVEKANGGTLFLDEIGEVPLGVQAKLLRVLETKRVSRVGDTREIEVDVRVVAATNRNLADEVKVGRFRQDLFFRLSGGIVWLPPLRDRTRELSVLAHLFLREACGRTGRSVPTISDAAMRVLASHSWPGNLRELKNLMDYLAATAGPSTIEARLVAERLGMQQGPSEGLRDALPSVVVEPEPEPEPGAVEGVDAARFRNLAEELRDLERTRILEALEACGGNRTKAAQLIGMPLRTLLYRLRQYGLARRSND